MKILYWFLVVATVISSAAFFVSWYLKMPTVFAAGIWPLVVLTFMARDKP